MRSPPLITTCSPECTAIVGVCWKGQNTHRRDKPPALLDFLVGALGGPAAYHGLDMKAAHHGLGIDASEWSAKWSPSWTSSASSGRKEEFLAAAAGLCLHYPSPRLCCHHVARLGQGSNWPDLSIPHPLDVFRQPVAPALVG